MTTDDRSWSDAPTSRSLPLPTGRKTTMTSHRNAQTLAVCAATGAAVVMATGVGYAFWSTSGSGTGTAGTGTPKPIVISTTGVTQPTDLVPNGTGVVVARLDNTVTATTGNNFTVQVTKVNTVTITADDAANCPATNLSVNKTLPYTLPAALSVNANTTALVSIADLVKLATAAPDTCQGKTFTITLSMS